MSPIQMQRLTSQKRKKHRPLKRLIQNPKDKRSRLLLLTEEGKALLARAVPIWESEHAAIDSEIRSVEGEALRAGLAELV